MLTLELYLMDGCPHCNDVKVFFLGKDLGREAMAHYNDKLAKTGMTLKGIREKLEKTKKSVNIKHYDAEKDAKRCASKGVNGYPTFIFVSDGKDIKRIEGFGGVTKLDHDISETLTETTESE